MVARLLEAGHPLTVLARRDEVRRDLEQAGAHVVGTAAEVAEVADVIVVCLFSDDQLRELSDGLLSSVRPGAVIASHITGRRSALLELARRAAAAGAHVVDAPVSGGVDEIEAGALTVMLGGEPSPVDAVDEVVAAYADPRIRTGGLGSALAVKLINNLLFATHAQTAAAALALGDSLGVDQQGLLRVLESASGRSFASSSLARTGSVLQWTQVVGEFMRKDIAACEAELRAAGSDGGLLVDVVHRGPLSLTG